MKPEVLRKRRASSQSCLEKPFTNLQPQGKVRLDDSTPSIEARRYTQYMTSCTAVDRRPGMAASMPAPVTQQMAPSQCQNTQQCLLALKWLGTVHPVQQSVPHTRPGLLMHPASFP